MIFTTPCIELRFKNVQNLDHLALTQTGGNVTKAAEIAKKERRAFTRLMAKHGIMRESFSQVG